ncbi:MAG: heme exporter protein CcmD [Hyphomicrobium sp.]|jgi:heme exporter protein D|uniref:heme exporter protein CcmD n=1 Tax=Hyphomicrobium sp. TaxID=82 RepID=UPI0025C06F74|nr:heme exporter protein CcmD [Hyphomicrobium sp.]MBX9863632.1 heme exporter protein CcmD [Hyphomicrobium sp.]
MDFGPHAAFIWGSYGAFVLIVGLLIGWTLFDAKRQASALADAERRGLKRRSADAGADRGA